MIVGLICPKKRGLLLITFIETLYIVHSKSRIAPLPLSLGDAQDSPVSPFSCISDISQILVTVCVCCLQVSYLQVTFVLRLARPMPTVKLVPLTHLHCKVTPFTDKIRERGRETCVWRYHKCCNHEMSIGTSLHI